MWIDSLTRILSARWMDEDRSGKAQHMIKLAKYLKGSLGIIGVIFVLLAFQAWGDLELPSYTSKIVTQGIQQKGVEDPVPERIRSETLRDVKLFLEKEQTDLLESAYEAEENGSGSDIYHLKKISAGDRQVLAETLVNSELILLMLTSEEGDYSTLLGAGPAVAANDGGDSAVDPDSAAES